MSQKTIKIYDGDTLTTDALYCRNTETGEIGWYDYISETFYPAPLKQYIDTGIDPASLRPKGEWISVEDRKPKGFSVVLVYEPGLGVGEARWDGRKFRWTSDENTAFATHWMPLPEPPNTEVAHDS